MRHGWDAQATQDTSTWASWRWRFMESTCVYGGKYGDSPYGWIRSQFVAGWRQCSRRHTRYGCTHWVRCCKNWLSRSIWKLEVEFVESTQNKADMLTRVPRKWLVQPKDKEALTTVASCVEVTDGLHLQVTVIHLCHHFGADQMLEFMCWGLGQRACQGHHLWLSPVRVYRSSSELQVGEGSHHQRLSMATHRGRHHTCWWVTFSVMHRLPLSVYNLAKSVWWVGQGSMFADVEDINWNGTTKSLMMDNGMTFCSSEMQRLLTAWDVKAEYACAYWPQVSHIWKAPVARGQEWASAESTLPMMAVRQMMMFCGRTAWRRSLRAHTFKCFHSMSLTCSSPVGIHRVPCAEGECWTYPLK